MICRLFCCEPEQEEEDEIPQNNNKKSTGSINKNIKIQENQILEIFGLENYAMVRKTFKNFFILEKESQQAYDSSVLKDLYFGCEDEIYGNEQCKRIPKKVVEFLIERCAMTGTDLQIVVPYCANGAIPILIAKHKNISNVIAFDPNTININQAKNHVQQNQLSNKIDLINSNQSNFRLKADILFIYMNQYDHLYGKIVIQMAQFVYLAKSFVLIVDSKVNLQLLISQIIPFFRLIKLEIMILSINGITQYNCVLIGKVSATKFHSEKATIMNLLLEDITEKVLYLEKTEQLLLSILEVEKMQTIVKLLIQAKAQAQDNLILSYFFYLLTSHKITTSSNLFLLYGDLYKNLQLEDTGDYHQISMSIRNQTFEFKDCKAVSNEIKSHSNLYKINTLSFQNEKGW